jgi:hypothetical protein
MDCWRRISLTLSTLLQVNRIPLVSGYGCYGTPSWKFSAHLHASNRQHLLYKDTFLAQQTRDDQCIIIVPIGQLFIQQWLCHVIMAYGVLSRTYIWGMYWIASFTGYQIWLDIGLLDLLDNGYISFSNKTSTGLWCLMAISACQLFHKLLDR